MHSHRAYGVQGTAAVADHVQRRTFRIEHSSLHDFFLVFLRAAVSRWRVPNQSHFLDAISPNSMATVSDIHYLSIFLCPLAKLYNGEMASYVAASH